MFSKIFGVFLIFVSIIIVVNLIPGFIALLRILGEAISNNVASYWGKFTASLLIQALGWIIAYYSFLFGRRLYKS